MEFLAEEYFSDELFTCFKRGLLRKKLIRHSIIIVDFLSTVQSFSQKSLDRYG